jgi:hypothetical protein
VDTLLLTIKPGAPYSVQFSRKIPLCRWASETVGATWITPAMPVPTR